MAGDGYARGSAAKLGPPLPTGERAFAVVLPETPLHTLRANDTAQAPSRLVIHARFAPRRVPAFRSPPPSPSTTRSDSWPTCVTPVPRPIPPSPVPTSARRTTPPRRSAPRRQIGRAHV